MGANLRDNPGGGKPGGGNPGGGKVRYKRIYIYVYIYIYICVSRVSKERGGH